MTSMRRCDGGQVVWQASRSWIAWGLEATVNLPLPEANMSTVVRTRTKQKVSNV
jgi:hypothetical protein